MSLLIVNTIQPQTGSIVNISGSLQISQSLIVADDITLSGKLTLGDANTDNIVVNSEFTSSLIPDVDGAFDLGSTVKKWGTLFAKTGSFDHLSGSIDLTNGLINITSASISYLTGSSPVTVGGAMIPDTNDTHDLGSATKNFRGLYVGGISASGDITSSGGTGSFAGGVDAMDATGSFGYISASGDISTSGVIFGNNIVGTLSTQAQPEITSLGTITNLLATNITASGHVSASSYRTNFVTVQDSSISGTFTINTALPVSASRVSASHGFEADTASTSSFGHISASGDVSSAANIYGAGTGSFIGGVVANTSTGSFGAILGTLVTPEQTNITSLGTITNLVVASMTASGTVKITHGQLLATAGVTASSLQTNNVTITAGGHVSASRVSASAGFEADDGSTSTFGIISASGAVSAEGNISSSATLLGTGLTLASAGVNALTITTAGALSASSTIKGTAFEANTNGVNGWKVDASGNVSGGGTLAATTLTLATAGTTYASINATGTASFLGGIDCIGDGKDATGSFGYISCSGDISASGTGSFEHLIVTGEITSNVSSSGTGSFTGGINAIESTGSFGYISASGDISSSGTGSFEHLTVTGEITSNVSSSGTGSFQGGIESPGATGSFGYISSSGDISSSASGSFLHLSISGSGSFSYLFVSASDQLNTAISASGGISASYFSGDGRHLENVTASFVAGGTTAAGSDTQLQFNDGGSLGADAGLLYNKTTDTLSISGSLIVGGNGTPGLGAISASRVSASLGFEADTLSTSSFGYISCSGDITSSGTGFFAGGINCISPGGDDVDATGSFGYISCSGDISISGDFFSTHITASGDISGSIVKGQQIIAQEGDNLGIRFNTNSDTVVNAIRYKTIGERAHLQAPSLPVSITLPFSASSTALVGGTLTVGGAATIAGTATAGTVNATDALQIGGVQITATAAELNKMDGFIGTTDQLNGLIKTVDADIEASKAVKYDADGAVKAKKVIKSSTVTLTAGDSDALLSPTGSTAQAYTLPSVADAKGVRFEFIAGSAQQHRITSPSSDIFGQIIDNSNAATLARTELEGSQTITLVNPKIGDRITIISDGARYYVEGRTNDTPGLA